MAEQEMKHITLLLTGGTGTFGSYLINHLLTKGVHLILLVRASSHEAARVRVQEMTTIPDDVEVYRADLTHPNLGLSETEYGDLTRRVTHILHAAANTRFTLPLEDARLQNVETTQRMVDFALACTQLIRFGYMSSALVAGRRVGTILEDEFEHTAGFNSTYQQSKYEAEELVRKYLDRIPFVIIRPPLIISRPHANYEGPVNLLSHMIKLIKRKLLPLAPGSRESTFDMVDGDETARLAVELTVKNQLKYLTYHIANDVHALTVGKVIDILELHMQRKIDVEFCGDIKEFKRRVWWKSLFSPQLRVVYKKISSYIPEPAFPKIFDTRHLLEELNMSTMSPQPEKVFSTILE